MTTDRAVDVSIVMPVHNGADHLREQLDSVAAQKTSFRWELIVVDHRSSDGSGDIARSYAGQIPNLRVIPFDRGQTPAYPRNEGARQALSNRLVFIDADDVTEPGWLQAMGQALAEARWVSGRLEHDSLNLGVGKYRRRHAETAVDRYFEFPLTLTSNMGCHREVFEAVDGFDESLPSGDDTDFSLRVAHGLGLEPLFVPDAVVAYRYRRGLQGIYEQGRSYGMTGPALAMRHRHAFESPPRLGRLLVAHGFRTLAAIVATRSRPDLDIVAFRLGAFVGRLRSGITLLLRPGPQSSR